jgi:acyl-coenzyme A thioesterase PaaI-like protein
MTGPAIQDRLVDNFCWGCGADNPEGLQLKSHWLDGEAVALWLPAPRFAAGPRHVLNGGIIATLLDCHGICTAVAATYDREGREIGTPPDLWCVTARIEVEYLQPTPIDAAVELVARVIDHGNRSSLVECRLGSLGIDRARATVRAVRVEQEWRHGGTDPAG